MSIRVNQGAFAKHLEHLERVVKMVNLDLPELVEKQVPVVLMEIKVILVLVEQLVVVVKMVLF